MLLAQPRPSIVTVIILVDACREEVLDARLTSPAEYPAFKAIVVSST
jgi:hypothetical protein